MNGLATWRGPTVVHLTVRERILLHLSDYSKFAETLEVPPEMAQEGIAHATGIQLPHFNQYARPLVREGLVRERIAHVRGVRRRRKVYDLTEVGRLAAIRLRDKVKSQIVRVRDAKGTREATIARLLEEVGGKASMMDLLRQLGEVGAIDLTALGAPDIAFVEFLSEAPRTGRFIGRRGELEAVTEQRDQPRVFVVRGVAGIGKSCFGAKACELLRGKRNLFWHRVRPWDTRHSILVAMGDFLSALGRPGLRSLLTRGEGTRADQALREDLPGTQSFLVFDDVHEASAEVLPLLRFLKEVISQASDVWLLVLTRRSVPFYDRRDVVLEGLVREIDLEGLGPEDMVAFLSGAEELVELGRRLGGHPLFLELLRSTPRPAPTFQALEDVHRFIEEQIYRELPQAERAMMNVACLYDVPMPREAFFPEPSLSHDVLLSLKDRALIRAVGQDSFEVHDTIRDFFAAILTEAERARLGGFTVRQLRQLASGARSAGDMVSCIGYLSNAVQLSLTPEERLAAWEALGDAHERIGDLPNTLVAYKEAARLASQPEALARLHRKTAAVLQVRGNMAAAAAEVEAALHALGKTPSAERGWLDLVRCQVNTQLEEWGRAREYGESALLTFRELDIPSGQAQALLALGNIEVNSPSGNAGSAEECLDAALHLGISLGDLAFTARAHIALAHLFAYRVGDAGRAMEHMAAIETLSDALGDPHMRRSFLMLRGWFNLELAADFATATANFSEAMAVGRKIHDAHTTAFAGFGLAFVAYFEGRLDEARSRFERCGGELRDQGFPGFAVESLWMVAECCLTQGDIEGFRRIVAAFDDPELSRGVEARIVLAKVLRGLDHLLKGDGKRSEAAFAEGLRLAEHQFEVQEWPLLHFAHFFYGVALRVMGREQEGAEHVRRAEELLAKYGLKARLSIAPSRERQLTEVLRRAARTA